MTKLEGVKSHQKKVRGVLYVFGLTSVLFESVLRFFGDIKGFVYGDIMSLLGNLHYKGSLCVWCQLSIAYSNRGRKWIMIGRNIWPYLHCLDVMNAFLCGLAHVWAGTQSSTQPPGIIWPGKFGKVFFLSKKPRTYMEMW